MAAQINKDRIIKIISDPELVKSRIFIKAVPEDFRNLKYCVHRKVGDICLALYIDLTSEEEPDADITAGMPEQVLAKFSRETRMTEDDVWSLAEQNTVRIFDPSFCSLDEMMTSFIESGSFYRRKLADTEALPEGDCCVFVLSACRQYGPDGCASMLFLPLVQQKLADLFNGDFYAVFMTNQEAMLHPVSLADPETLKQTLDGASEDAVPERERLSGHVWKYLSSYGQMATVA